MRKYIDAIMAAWPVLRKTLDWIKAAWQKLTAIKTDPYELGGHDEDEYDK